MESGAERLDMDGRGANEVKTNHQRQFKDDRGPDQQDSHHLFWFNRHPISSKISGKTAGYIGYEFTNGKRGAAKAIRGAKKFIRTRDRVALKRELEANR